MPFRLDFPANYKENVVIDLPQNWSVTNNETHLKNNCFSYDSKFYGKGNLVYFTAKYHVLKDHGEIKDAQSYFNDLDRYDKISQCSLTYNPHQQDEFPVTMSRKYTNILPALLLFFAIAIGLWRIMFRR